MLIPLTKTQQAKENHGKFSTDKIVPWSRWTVFSDEGKSQFEDFQQSVMNNLPSDYQTRLDWENDVWIKTANKT